MSRGKANMSGDFKRKGGKSEGIRAETSKEKVRSQGGEIRSAAEPTESER